MTLRNIGRERLDRRHRLHVIVREVIDRFNDRREVLHMGDKINLAAEITEAVMASANGENGDGK